MTQPTSPFHPVQFRAPLVSDPMPRFTISLSDVHMVHVMDTFEANGRYGNGYGWADVAVHILRTQLPALEDHIEIDPEGGCLFAHSQDRDALEELARALQYAFQNPDVLGPLVAAAPYEWD